MAIYDTSKRPPLAVRMSSLLLGSGGSSYDSWSSTASIGIGIAVFLYVTAAYSNTANESKRDTSASSADDDENNLNEVSASKSDNKDDAITAIYGFCRTLIRTLAESLTTLSKSSDEDATLIQARLKALAKARKTKAIQHYEDEHLKTAIHEGSCQCNSVKFQVRWNARNLLISS